MNVSKTWLSVDVFHPGLPYPVTIRETTKFWPAGAIEFAVHRPAISSRGGTCNAGRQSRDTFEAAYKLATKPLSEAVRKYYHKPQ